MAEHWRLIQDGPGHGAWNIGLDEALLRSAQEEGIATLRLYAWRGPWLSLGYAQRRPPAELLRDCERAGVGVVRRTTGGAAVLHGNDLTYSIAAPEERLASGLDGSYGQIAEALLSGLRELGLEAERRDAPGGAADPGSQASGSRRVAPGGRRSAVFDCFAEVAGHEICVAGRKLVGSAQRRGGGALLQHGSIRMGADPSAIARAAGVASGIATSLEDLGLAADPLRLRRLLVAGFSRALAARFEEASASAAEDDQARSRQALNEADPMATPRSRTRA